MDFHQIILNSKFNPIKALYSEKVKVPVENAKIYDNLNVFLSRLKNAGNAFDANLEKSLQTQSKTVKDPTEAIDKEKYHVTEAGRKFLKEQAPVHRGPKMRLKRNIFSRMETVQGPTSLLNKFKVNRTRVKIYIRKEHGIRGSISGFIEAFDKHFNIALVDCIEVWKRRKFGFSDNKVALLGPPEDCSQLLHSMGIKVPEIATKSVNRKVVECTRKIPQLMVRGEDVILIGEDGFECKQKLDVMTT